MNIRPLLLVFVITIAIAPAIASAHGGGLDKCGGHEDRGGGGYHVHDWALFCGCNPKAEECILKQTLKPGESADTTTPTTPTKPTKPAPPSPGTSPPQQSGNTQIASFNTAKKFAFAVHDEHRITLYCGCRYDGDLVVDHTSCGYQSKSGSHRATKVEWEHVVPADAFGQSFKEWRDGDPTCVNRKGESFKGRNCARKASSLFRLMEADIYNLYPAIGEINNLRSNYSMADLPGEPREFGQCDVEIHDGKFEPRPEIRGDIARTYFYMDAAYPGRGIISRKNRPLFEAWDRQDPVDAWECERAALVAEFQGNVNTIVATACENRVKGAVSREPHHD